jgi:hypothetical protein
MATGRRFTAANTLDDYRRFAAALRDRRPFEPWPVHAEAALAADWDLTRHNPWIPHPRRFRRLARRGWNWVKGWTPGAEPQSETSS